MGEIEIKQDVGEITGDGAAVGAVTGGAPNIGGEHHHQPEATGQHVVQVNLPSQPTVDPNQLRLWLEFLEHSRHDQHIPISLHGLLITAAVYGAIVLLVLVYVISMK